uniref:Uncharacterized protein n=1 Tax=Rhizophora mucronata TaxID=61149 RepID=A0A2P2P168_RHIMU
MLYYLEFTVSFFFFLYTIGIEAYIL